MTIQQKRVAKLLLQDSDGSYLLLYSNNHPMYGDGPDLPGGTIEANESIEQGMVREVFEEAGIHIADYKVLYSGDAYSRHGTHKSLYYAQLPHRPDVVLSWEHKSYTWVSYDTLIQECLSSKDDYMHMVADVMKHAHESNTL